MNDLLTLADIAKMFRCTETRAKEEIVRIPGFPEPVHFSTPRNKRWLRKEVRAFLPLVRQALALALRDGAINSSPIEGLEPATHQRPPPDPFSRDEAEAIIAGMAARYNDQIANYFGFKFFTGLRTSESLIVRWESLRAGHQSPYENHFQSIAPGKNWGRIRYFGQLSSINLASAACP